MESFKVGTHPEWSKSHENSCRSYYDIKVCKIIAIHRIKTANIILMRDTWIFGALRTFNNDQELH
jgi:hypothetical protein